MKYLFDGQLFSAQFHLTPLGRKLSVKCAVDNSQVQVPPRLMSTRVPSSPLWWSLAPLHRVGSQGKGAALLLPPRLGLGWA